MLEAALTPVEKGDLTVLYAIATGLDVVDDLIEVQAPLLVQRDRDIGQ